jgi:protein-S-isoprenylcysteine O-methyltransferase Ste14
VAAVAVPLMLDAIWALLPALAIVIATVVRAGLEDRMLREGLPGYEEYARTTRFRLVPGLW